MADNAKDIKPWETPPPPKIGGEKMPWETEPPPAPVSSNEPMSKTDAAIIKGQEGALLGLRPIVAGIGAAAGNLTGQVMDKISGEGNNIYLSGPVDAFKEARADANAEQDKASADHPYISAGSNIGGTLLTAPLLPAGAGLRGALRIGAGLGAAQAAGSANSLPEAVENVGAGMAGGGIGYGAAKTAGAVASNALSSLAENKAFKAAGAMLKDFRAAFARNPERINELGRTMLDEGLVKPGDSVNSIAKKASELKLNTGKKIGEVYDNVLDQLTSHETQIAPEAIMQIQEAGFHPEAQADLMKKELSKKFGGQAGSTSALAKANQVIDEIAVNGNNITPEHAIDIKNQIDGMISWGKKKMDLPIEQQALMDVRNFIQGRLTDQVQLMDQALGSNQSKELVRLNKLYGNVAQISDIAADRVLRQSANQSFGLGDKVAAGVGAAAGGAPGAIGLGALNHLAQSYGNAFISTGADALGRTATNPSSYAPMAMEAVNQMRAPKMSTTIRKRDELRRLSNDE